jgi:hypothetical protein
MYHIYIYMARNEIRGAVPRRAGATGHWVEFAGANRQESEIYF